MVTSMLVLNRHCGAWKAVLSDSQKDKSGAWGQADVRVRFCDKHR